MALRYHVRSLPQLHTTMWTRNTGKFRAEAPGRCQAHKSDGICNPASAWRRMKPSLNRWGAR